MRTTTPDAPLALLRATPGSSDVAVLAACAAAYFAVLVLPSLSPHYGFYSDELYYLACAKRLALGYVDHPPFFPFVLRLHRELFGDSLIALRTLPAAAGAATVFLAGWLARRMGGGRFAQILAAFAVMVSGMSLAMFSWFSVNCLEILLWTTASWIFVELLRSREPKLWLALGAVLGVSLLNKHTTVLLIAGLAAATALSPLRRDWRGPRPWAAALVALLIFAPNIYWQAANGWPSLDFYRRIAGENIPTSPLGVLGFQIVAQNPAALPIWVAGLIFFLASRRGRRFRPLGWMFLTVLILALVGGQRRADRIAGVYPTVVAGGAVLLEALRRGGGRLRNFSIAFALPSLMLLIGVAAATLLLPILPPDVLAKHPLFDGTDDWRRQVGRQKIPYHLGNRTHWKQLVAQVDEVYEDLDSEQRKDAIILADYFGHAGAIERYGREYNLPPVYSPHTGYFLWGPPDGSPSTVISIGIDEDFLRANFERVRTAAIFRCEYCPRWQDELPIRLATSPKRAAADYWPELGRIGGMDRLRRLLRSEETG